MRVVSLCPSLTETVFHLGLERDLVGITDWCIHPADGVNAVEKVGGTKTPNVARIVELRPDLVLLNDEENCIEDADALAEAGIRCLSTFPKTVLETAAMVRVVGAALSEGDDATAKKVEALALAVEDCREAALSRAAGQEAVRFAYMIWRQPWMAVGSDTYASDLLTLSGGVNVFADAVDRYGEIQPADLTEARPDLVLLCTEPFPFNASHADELAALAGIARDGIRIADGELLSWHGSRTPAGVDYGADLIDSARS
jgi:ABC-type Fe3+-hydroxamate transport system substrate-binding protein